MDPLKEWSYVAILLAVAGYATYFVHHERDIGRQQIITAQKKADEKEAAHVKAVQDEADKTIGQLGGQLRESLGTPPADPIHARLCYKPVAPPNAARGIGSPGPGSDGAGRPSDPVADAGGDSSTATEGGDIGPPTEALLNRLGAKLKYLQDYVHACQKAGNCKVK